MRPRSAVSTRARSRVRRVCVVLTAVAAVSVSCTSGAPTADALRAAYDLESVDGDALPFPHFITLLSGDTLMIVGAELSVLSRGRVRIVRRFQLHPTTAPPGPITSDTIVRAYRESGGQMYIAHPATSQNESFTDTVQVLPNSLLAVARIVTPIASTQAPIIRREMYYARR